MRHWSATEMPRFRRDLVAALDNLAYTDEHIGALDAQAASRAELFWVTPDMTTATIEHCTEPATRSSGPRGSESWKQCWRSFPRFRSVPARAVVV